MNIKEQTFYRFNMEGIDGQPIDFSNFNNKKVLIVNVASECGFTPQYSQLQELHEHFKDQVVVIGCPCNDFGGQEPGDESAIQSFCQMNYGVSFPLTRKVRIVKQPDELYKWLTSKALNGKKNVEVTWNFHKFIINENGEWQAAFPPNVEPFDDALLSALDIQIF